MPKCDFNKVAKICFVYLFIIVCFNIFTAKIFRIILTVKPCYIQDYPEYSGSVLTG